MRRSLVAVLFALAACGNSTGAGTDAGGDDQPGDDAGGGGAHPHTVKLTLTNRPTNAANFSFVVGYQDGSAPWQLAPAPSGDTYTFAINAPSYGVAFTCIGASAGTATQLRTVTAAFFAVGERTELTLDVPSRCSDRAGMGAAMMNGSVTNRPLTGTLVAVWGARSAFVGPQTGNFQISAPPGTHDLFILHVVSEGNGDFYTDEVAVVRDVTLSGTASRTVDFAEARPTTQYDVDTSSVDPNARISASTTLYTANGTQTGLLRETFNADTVALADAQRTATDVYDHSIQVSVLGRSATITHATNAPAEQTWEAPPPFGMVQPSVAAKMPYVVLQAMWPAYPNVTGYIWSAAQQLSGDDCGNGVNTSCAIAWQAYLSPGVTGAMPAFRMPELAGLAGWKPELQLVAGSTVYGSVTACTSTAGAGDFPAGIPANGTDRAFVRSDFALTP